MNSIIACLVKIFSLLCEALRWSMCWPARKRIEPQRRRAEISGCEEELNKTPTAPASTSIRAAFSQRSKKNLAAVPPRICSFWGAVRNSASAITAIAAG